MKTILVAVLALVLVGVMTPSANAAKEKQTYTFTVINTEGGKSNVSGTVRVQAVGKDKTQFHFSLTGLQASTNYKLTWSTSTDCSGDASNVITSFTTRGNGSITVTKNVTVDMTTVSSIGLRSDTPEQTLVGCASTTP